MSGRTPQAVAEAHRSRLQRVIDCVTPAIISNRRVFSAQHAPTGVITLFLGDGQPARLRGPVPVLLEMSHRFRVVSEPGVPHAALEARVVSYLYTLSLRDGSEIVAYHWHPDSLSDNTDPHLHLGPASTRLDSAVWPRELHKVHFPTGHVTLEQVIRPAIVELGVTPRRAVWASVLDSRADSR